MTTDIASNSPLEQLSFEAAYAQLEQLIDAMESGELSLEKSLAHYQQGTVLLQHCQNLLNSARAKVEVLESGVLKNFADGNAADAES